VFAGMATVVHVGDPDVPLVVQATSAVVGPLSPLFSPTQMMSELPGATAMALMNVLPGDRIAAHAGGAPLRTLVLRHKLDAPTSMVFALLGSRMNGAMKLACGGYLVGSTPFAQLDEKASRRLSQMNCPETPFVVR
jgi:hypothetical protein